MNSVITIRNRMAKKFKVISKPIFRLKTFLTRIIKFHKDFIRFKNKLLI